MKHNKRKIEELNLMDDFLFYEAVSGEKGEWFCRFLIKSMCGKEVKDIRIQPQSVIQGADTTRHGIRMDLYVDEKGKCLYDFEPDKYTDFKVLPKRNRYYRALADGKLLETGQEYDRIPDMWIIFILPYDPFGKDRMCYTIKNSIQEDPDIKYEDGAVTLYLNTTGHVGGNEELSLLLKYMEQSTAQNAKTQELSTLHNYVEEIKHNKKVGVRYMKSWEYERMIRTRGMEEGRKEGIVKGRAEGKLEGKLEGKAEDILVLLGELGTVSETLKEKIMAETDLELLANWLRLSARAVSIQEFEEKLLNSGRCDCTDS